MNSEATLSYFIEQHPYRMILIIFVCVFLIAYYFSKWQRAYEKEKEIPDWIVNEGEKK